MTPALRALSAAPKHEPAVLPILMSGPMVRAILAGRKTQTRRLWWRNGSEASGEGPWAKVKQGDLLWVRESLVRVGSPHYGWAYSADNTLISMRRSDPRVSEMIAWAHHKEGNSTPSIHMPRWASRLTLRVTEVRRQRLQDVTREDAIAEGCTHYRCDHPDCGGKHYGPRGAFYEAWEDLNGSRAPWFSNPEVAAISFRAVKENVDEGQREAARAAREGEA